MTSSLTRTGRSLLSACDRSQPAPPPDEAARDQIALITGSDDTPIRIRAIHWDRSEEGRRRHPSYEFEGTLASTAERTSKLNLDGYNVYIVAQRTKPLPAKGYFTRDTDIIGVRCLYADGDDSELPSEWHVEPTFILVHPKTGRWWAYWIVTNFPLDQLRDMVKRIAIHYDGDISICNPARIVRLAGYDRWKDGKNYGPYELQRRSGGTWEWWAHDGTLDKLPPRAAYIGPRDVESVIELNRLRQLLLLVPPGEREDWLKVMLMVRDGTVIDDKFRVLDDADKLEHFDSWASGELYSQMTGVSL